MELYGQATTLPPMPDPLAPGHLSFLTNDGDLIYCGDRPDSIEFDSTPCLLLRPSLEPQECEAGVVESLQGHRTGASVVTLAAVGTYVMGSIHPSSTEVMLTGSYSWTTGPEMPMHFYYGCATPISRHQFLAFGHGSFGTTVREFDARGDGGLSPAGWKPIATWPPLPKQRQGHVCSTIGRKVVIVGGDLTEGGLESAFTSTDILDLDSKLVRTGGILQTPRQFFQLVTVGEGAGQRLLAFGGGQNCSVGNSVWNLLSASMLHCETSLSSVEEWSLARGTWQTQELMMDTPRSFFSSVAIPPSLQCHGDLPTIPHGAVDCPDTRGVGTTCTVTCTTDLYQLERNTSSTVVCGWGSAWVTRARCGE